MISKQSNRTVNLIIILVLGIALLVVSIFYVSERIASANEIEYLNGELDRTSITFYQSQVEDNLKSLLISLGLRPVDDVDWEGQYFQMVTDKFLELNKGITNIATPTLITERIPENLRTELQGLQRNLENILSNLQNEQELNLQTKEEIMNFTAAVHKCVQFAESQTWNRMTNDIECLNEEIIGSVIK